MTDLTSVIDARNRGIVDLVYPAIGPAGPAGKDLTGPLNIDGGKPQSFYAGLASVDAGYYNETYGGMLYGLDGGTP